MFNDNKLKKLNLVTTFFYILLINNKLKVKPRLLFLYIFNIIINNIIYIILLINLKINNNIIYY